MSLEYKKQTDKEHKETLESKIVHASWGRKAASVGDMVKFFVQTHFVGNGSEIEIEAEDKKGTKIANVKGQVFGDQFAGSILISENAKEEVTFTAKLPKHGLTTKSAAMKVFPLIRVTNLKWGQKEARRGDVVKLTADIEGVPDETEVMLSIYEFDWDRAHDFITRFPSEVKNKKIEAQWEYEYHEDTEDIPTQEEMEKYGKNYYPPEYFFTVTVYGNVFGKNQESELLEFKDWIDLELKAKYSNHPIPDEEYSVILADGSEIKGRLDAEGRAKIEKIPPGKYKILFPGINLVESKE